MAIIRKRKTKLDDFIIVHPYGNKDNIENIINMNDIIRIGPHIDDSPTYARRRKKNAQYTDILLSTGKIAIVSETIDNIKKQLSNCVI